MNIVLRPLTLADKDAFFEGVQLFSDMDLDWYTFAWKEGMSFEDHLKVIDDEFNGKDLPETRVPASMLYAFLEGKIVGRSSIRHKLNDYLFVRGGNIGYAVATMFRNRGIATEILRQTLIYCKEILKLEKVLITCSDDNTGSYKAIEKNGGVLENKHISDDGTEISRRYWIEL
jgi:predicted acetyltransferase